MSMPAERPAANSGPRQPAPPTDADKITISSIGSALLDNSAHRELRTQIRALLAQLEMRGPANPERSGVDDGQLWASLSASLSRAGIGLVDVRGGRQRMWETLSVAAEELGGVPVDVPLLTSSVIAATMTRRLGQHDLASRLLRGATTATFLTPYEQPFRSTAAGRFRDGRVWATVDGVAGAAHADLMLVLCEDKLVCFDREGADLTPAACLDATRALSEVSVRGALATVLAQGDRVLHAAAAAAAAASALLAVEQAALAETCRRLIGVDAEEPATQRSGRHAINLDKARSAARYAVQCLAVEDPHASIAVSTARVVCSAVSFRAAHDAQSARPDCRTASLLAERARGSALAFGGPVWHRRRLANLVTLSVPDTHPVL